MRTAVIIVAAWLCVGFSTADAATTIEKVLPFTPEADAVRIVVAAKGSDELTGTITPWRQKTVVWTGSLGKVGDNGELEKKLEGLKVKPWSPGSPNLYELTVAGGGATKTVRFGFRKFESKNGQFHLNGQPIFMRGLAINPPGRGVPKATGETKEFALDYVDFLRKQNLNLIRLNDDSQEWFDACDELGMMVYQGFYGSPPTGLTKEEEAAEKKALEPARTSQQSKEEPVETEGAIDGDGIDRAAAGTVSLVGQAEAGGKRLPTNFERSYGAYKERFETYVRHPSIVIYVLTNEMPYQKEAGKAVHDFLTKMYDRLKVWDHTRLYIGNAGYGEGKQGDINDVHRYWGWYYNSYATFYNLRDPKLFGEYDKNQPFTFSECIGNFTGPTGAYNLVEKKQLAAALCWTGYSTNQVEDAQNYQAFMNKQGIEIFRRLRPINPRISGLMPFTITFHNWNGIKSFSQMKPTAASIQMGTSYSPVLLSWECWTPQVYAGTKLKAFAHVINDAEDFSALSDATLTYELANKTQTIDQPTKIDVPSVPYYGTWKQPVEIDLPEGLKSGEYRLVGTLRQGTKVLNTNHFDIFIAGSEWKQPRKAGQRRIVLYDPSGKTKSALASLNVAATEVKDFDKLDAATDTLVIGQETWSPEVSKQRQKLVEFMKAGGRILLMGQAHKGFNESWLPAKITPASVSANDHDYPPKKRPSYDHLVINPQRPGHPIFAGVERDRLKYWSDNTGWDETKDGFPNIYSVRYGFMLTEPKDLGKVAILADYDRGLEGCAIAEMFEGEGSVLLFGLDVASRAGVDPVADRMLGNAVDYMTSSQPHQVHPLADKPIKWGDYASHIGFISGPVQGLFINVVWMPPPTDPKAEPLAKEKGSWNSRPGDQFNPEGVRPRGPFRYSTNCIPHDVDKKATVGSGQFWASLPPGRKTVVTKVRNPTDKPATLKVQVNDAGNEDTPIPPGKTITIQTPIQSRALIVNVQYTGEKELVILETDFR